MKQSIKNRLAQIDEHVKCYDKHLHEVNTRWSRRLRGEEGPPLNMNVNAVKAVIDALRATKKV
jgi:hypothetical protein